VQREELKKALLDILETDKEFRLAITALIGYKELLERISKVEEEIRALREETYELRRDMQEGFKRHDEEFKKHWEAIENLRRDMQEGFRRNDEEFKKHWEAIENLRRDMQEGFKRHDEEFKKHWEAIENLRRDMQEGFKIVDKRLKAIEAYVERTSLTLEEEAREVLKYRLKDEGLELSLSNLILPDIEIDIYGTNEDICIIGEVKTRTTPKIVEEVDKDIEALRNKYPQYLRKKIIKVIYAMQVLPEAIKEAEKKKIWLVTAIKNLTELTFHEI